MKKLLKLFLCVLVLFLCAFCTVQAEETETTECIEHTPNCLGICAACGTEGLTASEDHNWDHNNWGYDDTSHWLICKDCAVTNPQGTHYSMCYMDLDVCSSCGQSDVTITDGSKGCHAVEDWDTWETDDAQHWHICVWCENPCDVMDHSVNCQGTCMGCGKTGFAASENHDWDWDNVGYTETHHWLVCKECAVTSDQYTHYSMCTSPNVCEYCGRSDGITIADGSKSQHIVENWENWESDDAQHWHICMSCKNLCDVIDHTPDCQGVCKTCGKTGLTASDNHNWDWNTGYQYDATYHWIACLSCEEKLNYNKHYLYCDTGACSTCGQTNVEGGTEHHWDWENYGHTETEHWLPCTSCDATTNAGSHYSYCNAADSTVCAECGQSGVSMDTSHEWNWDAGYQHDTTYHWLTCTYCTEKTNYSQHYSYCNAADPTVCAECGQSGVTVTGDHEWDYDNWYWNDTECWRKCSKCQADSYHWSHTNMCYTEDDTVCTNCGQSGVVLEGVDCHGVGDPNNWQYDETQHWLACGWCGTRCDVQNHSSNGAGACSVCGAAVDSTIDCSNHQYSDFSEWRHEGDYHWQACPVCGEMGPEGGKVPHYINCEYNTECLMCGSTEIANATYGHYDPHTMDSDETQHWNHCTACGETFDYANHTVHCGTGVCDICGATGVEGDVEHYVSEESQWQYDINRHWLICVGCGIEIAKGAHLTDCLGSPCTECGATEVAATGDHVFDWNTPDGYDDDVHWYNCSLCGAEKVVSSTHGVGCGTDYCWLCGATGLEATNHLVGDDEAEYDENYHWYYCNQCGAEAYKNPHSYDCLTHACSCGVVNEYAEVSHAVENWGDWVYNDTHHYQMCINCNSGFDYYEHIVPCNGSACSVCGATDVAGGTGHTGNWDNAQYTDTEHWVICEVCGEQAWLNTHFEFCWTVDGACDACGITDVSMKISHANTANLLHDETQHWYGCYQCDEKIDPEAHTVNSEGTCTECGATGLPVCEHDYQYTVVKAATCTAAGSGKTACTLCGDVQSTQTIPAKGHSSKTTTTAATCTTAGVTQSVCSRCSVVLSSETIPATGHTMSVVVSTTSATCLDQGYTTYTCASGCDVTEIRDEVAALGHDITVVVEVIDPTCLAAGHTEYKCIRCDVTEICDEVAALGHDTAIHTTEPTCTTDGLQESICSRCNAVISSQVLPMLGHDYHDGVTTEATCTEDGVLDSICSRCNDLESSEAIPALGHDRWYTVTPATCIDDGTLTYYCNRCGKTLEREPVAALGHDLSSVDTGDSIVETCSRCDYENVTIKATEAPAAASTPAPTIEPTAEATMEPEVEATDVPTAAPAVLPEDTVVTPVENAVVEADQPLESIQIVVNEVELEEEPVLPLPEEIEPAKVITVALIVPEEIAAEEAIPEYVTVTILLTDEEVTALEGTKLVLVLSDGTMIEIPYEIVDGKLVFTTSQLGVFAFIPADQVI